MQNTQSSGRETALITGASAGIGYELAKVFAREGFDLILVARNVDRLNEVASELKRAHGCRVSVIPKDLAVTDSARVLFEEVAAMGLDVDVLVNNAGIGVYGAFAETDFSTEWQLLELNIVSLTALTKLFLKGMVARGHGRILNVASTAAFQPGPFMAVYFASKAYVLSLSEALASELAGSGVSVTVLCPGATQSEFFKRAKMQESRLVQGRLADATQVAEEGYRGLMAGETIVVPGILNRIGAKSVGLFPRKWVTSISRKLMERTTTPSEP